MKMQSVKWLKSTAVSLLTIVAGASSALAVDGTTSGQAAGNTALTKFGSKTKVNTNISQPMTNSSTLMQTVDGSKSFQATLNAPSSNKFLEVFIQPAGTGDLQQVVISQDNNADGTTDNVYAVPVLVSAVCANGLISCTAGTWQNCTNYTWGTDASNNVSAIPASLTDLGGCYCINSSCGSNLVWQNSSIILKDLGGGIVNAIHQNNPALTISSVTNDMVSITYFGQITNNIPTATSSVTALASSPAVSSATGYYRNSTQLTAARDNISISQSSDPSSLYYMMSNSAAAQNSQGKMSSCTVDRIAGVSSTTKSFNDMGTGQLCTDHLAYIREHKVDEQTYQLQYLDTGPGGLGAAHNNCNDSPGGDGWHTLRTVTLPPVNSTSIWKLTAATFSLTNIGTGGCNVGSGTVDGVINGFDSASQTSLVCGGRGAQAPSFDWSYFFEFSVDEFTESVDNKCSAMESDPDCKIKDELIDGVVTFQNFTATGLIQLPSCQTFTGSAGSNKICRPWWRKKRTYVCGAAAPFDFSNIGTRFGKVETTVADNTSSLTFQDPRLGPTGWTTANGSIGISKTLGADCELGCKTRVPKIDTQTTTGGNVTDLRMPSQSFDIFYRTCVDGICPVEDPTEQIMENCTCLNNFPDTAVFVQTLRLAGKDMICSGGQKKPL